MFARSIFLFAALVLPLQSVFAVALGATRDEVIQELGQPIAHAQLGSREILTYPKKVRIELEDGRVASADHLILKIVDPTPTPAPTDNPIEADTPITVVPKTTSTAGAPIPAVAPTPVPASPAQASTPQPTTKPPPAATAPPVTVALTPTTPPVAPTALPTQVPTVVPTQAPAVQFNVSSTGSMAAPIAPTPTNAASTPTLHPSSAPATPPAVAPSKSLLSTVEAFHSVSLFDANELPTAGRVMLLALHFAITLLAVYFAFRIWNLDALTSGIILIAVIDTALHALFEALGPMTSGLSTMSAVENGIPGVVMIFTVHHFAFGKKIPEAVRVAAAVKVIVFAVKLVATAALLDFVFPVH